MLRATKTNVLRNVARSLSRNYSAAPAAVEGKDRVLVFGVKCLPDAAVVILCVDDFVSVLCKLDARVLCIRIRIRMFRVCL